MLPRPSTDTRSADATSESARGRQWADNPEPLAQATPSAFNGGNIRGHHTVSSNVVTTGEATMKHRQSYEQCKEQVRRYRENGCCTVIALANTMDWSFGKAHRYMRKFGRRDCRGMALFEIARVMQELGKERGDDCQDMTINRFVKSHPKGSYYVLVRGHALAVVDGKVQDWTGDTAQRRKIIEYYKMG